MSEMHNFLYGLYRLIIGACFCSFMLCFLQKAGCIEENHWAGSLTASMVFSKISPEYPEDNPQTIPTCFQWAAVRVNVLQTTKTCSAANCLALPGIPQSYLCTRVEDNQKHGGNLKCLFRKLLPWWTEGEVCFPTQQGRCVPHTQRFHSRWWEPWWGMKDFLSAWDRCAGVTAGQVCPSKATERCSATSRMRTEKADRRTSR